MRAKFHAAEPQPLPMPRVRRARHFPRAGRLISVAVFLALSWIGLGMALWSGYQMSQTDDSLWGWLALSGLGLIIAGRSIAFMIGGHLNCSLCHGPVLHEKKCRKHSDAFRLAPLSHRTSAALSLLCTGFFRCMYCGTSYRLKK